MKTKRPLAAVTLALFLVLLASPVAAEYKPEFTLSLVIARETAWGRAAVRFSDVQLSTREVKAFRDKTRAVHAKWAEEIGADLVRNAESIVEAAR